MLRTSSSSGKPLTQEEIRLEENRKKYQEQLDIFYNTGRRIYKITKDNMHMKEFHNRPIERDIPDWNNSVKCGNNNDRGGQPWRIETSYCIKPNRYIMSHNDPNIEPGYKGIMDLDLTHIPNKFRKQAIEQHHKDIQEYKQEQRKRPERSRYEYTIERTERIHRADAIAADKRKREELEAQRLRDEQFAIKQRKYIERTQNIP